MAAPLDATLSVDSVITADDVVRAGACTGGVRAAVARLGDCAAAMPASAVLARLPADQRTYVERAVTVRGDGYGDGYGYGDGDG